VCPPGIYPTQNLELIVFTLFVFFSNVSIFSSQWGDLLFSYSCLFSISPRFQRFVYPEKQRANSSNIELCFKHCFCCYQQASVAES
jgi:hypothetical protein